MLYLGTMMNWLQNVFSGRDLINQGCFNETSRVVGIGKRGVFCYNNPYDIAVDLRMLHGHDPLSYQVLAFIRTSFPTPRHHDVIGILEHSLQHLSPTPRPYLRKGSARLDSNASREWDAPLDSITKDYFCLLFRTEFTPVS